MERNERDRSRFTFAYQEPDGGRTGFARNVLQRSAKLVQIARERIRQNSRGGHVDDISASGFLASGKPSADRLTFSTRNVIEGRYLGPRVPLRTCIYIYMSKANANMLMHADRSIWYPTCCSRRASA